MARGTKVLDTALYRVLEDWEIMEEHLDDALDAAPYNPQKNEWGYILAAKYLILQQIHVLQQQMTTHNRETCTLCQEEVRDEQYYLESLNRRLLQEAVK